VLRGRDVAIQAINLGIGVAALLTEEPAREDVTVLALVTTLGLIAVGMLDRGRLLVRRAQPGPDDRPPGRSGAVARGAGDRGRNVKGARTVNAEAI
jgi:hypothetical protein